MCLAKRIRPVFGCLVNEKKTHNNDYRLVCWFGPWKFKKSFVLFLNIISELKKSNTIYRDQWW